MASRAISVADTWQTAGMAGRRARLLIAAMTGVSQGAPLVTSSGQVSMARVVVAAVVAVAGGGVVWLTLGSAGELGATPSRITFKKHSDLR